MVQNAAEVTRGRRYICLYICGDDGGDGGGRTVGLRWRVRGDDCGALCGAGEGGGVVRLDGGAEVLFVSAAMVGAPAVGRCAAVVRVAVG